MAADPPVLTLLVQKGPREGETLQCRAGAIFRVGRVARGNALAVRDPGASQRHLAFEFLPASATWTVSDLGSSNGTLLNGAPLAPSTPAPLSHGDVVKIGESTVLAVSLPAAPAANPGRTRSSRHAAAAKSVEADEEEEEEEARVVTRGGGGRKKAASAEPASTRARSARVAARRGKEVGSGEEEEDRVGRGRRGAVTRASARKGGEAVLEVREEEEVAAAAAAASAAPRGEQRGRAPNARAVVKNAVKGGAEEEKDEERMVPNSEEEDRAVVGGGEAEMVMKAVEELPPVPRRGRTRRPPKARSNAQNATANGDKKEERKVLGQEGGSNVVEELGEISLPVLEPEGERTRVGTGEEEEGNGKTVEEDDGNDMDNMTLREWFKRMEKFLPAMIDEAAEEMIALLREKAQQFDEYLATLGADADAV